MAIQIGPQNISSGPTPIWTLKRRRTLNKANAVVNKTEGRRRRRSRCGSKKSKLRRNFLANFLGFCCIIVQGGIVKRKLMSVFGGDSWAREAQYRKRRVDDLLIEAIDHSAYDKLPSGKFVCLLCPNRPVLDTPLMLSTHVKGSRHRTAESKLRERELSREFEINKRIALTDPSSTTASTSSSVQKCGSASKPLIDRAQKAASEILTRGSSQCSMVDKSQDVRSDSICYYYKENPSTTKSTGSEIVAPSEEAFQQQLDYRERRERELKFAAAGWKRDGHGRWFKDENVEFDSDEEDPNVCLQ